MKYAPILRQSCLPSCEALSNLPKLALDGVVHVANAPLAWFFLLCVPCQFVFGIADRLEVARDLVVDVIKDVGVLPALPPLDLVRLVLHIGGCWMRWNEEAALEREL